MPTAPVTNNKPTFEYIKIYENTLEKLLIKDPPPTLTRNYLFSELYQEILARFKTRVFTCYVSLNEMCLYHLIIKRFQGSRSCCR